MIQTRTLKALAMVLLAGMTILSSCNTMSDEKIAISPAFHGKNGSAVFINGQTYVIHNPDDAEKRTSPCSTFKIISSMAIIESDAITSEEYMLPGYEVDWSPMENWNGNLTMKEAFEASCVWYYRDGINLVGQAFMQQFLNELDYGNCDISEWEGSGMNGIPLLDGFWLESSLQISPREQAELLQRIFTGETSISSQTIDYVKQMMRLTDIDCAYPVYGKTGTGQDGWFVGFFERDQNSQSVFFAVRMEGGNGETAKEMAVDIINTYYV